MRMDTAYQTTEDRRYYECRGCLTRVCVNAHLAACPDCGGRLRNLAVPRE